MLRAPETPQLSTAELLDDAPILVVDDDASLRNLCLRVLTAQGHQAHTACNGEEAIDKVRAQAYRIVLLDLKMSGMDGIECMKRLKAEGCRADVVIMTDFAVVSTAVDAMKVGARDFIEKPFRPQDLQALVEGILQRRSRDSRLSTDPVGAFIQQHATEISSRKDVANRLGVSLERVSTRVLGETQMSFREFLHGCRLEPGQTTAGNNRTRRLRDLDPHRLPNRTTLQPRLQQKSRRITQKIPPASKIRSLTRTPLVPPRPTAISDGAFFSKLRAAKRSRPGSPAYNQPVRHCTTEKTDTGTPKRPGRRHTTQPTNQTTQKHLQ